MELAILLIGVALGFGAAYQLRITAHDIAVAKHKEQKADLDEEIKRLRAQVARLIGHEPSPLQLVEQVGVPLHKEAAFTQTL